ncbi:HAT dimerization domain, Ribonuclease H-like domain protein [Artemisia annua]|uniref:HAT dimerization domain, Ribonuclease H-like domain protein n=1 Tax=Artemisia annua TaxID=35608 RepID=A0A2U1LC61_ARTAN|nr:HAT dimerization domain, Ribonuclease H-like domain protein [Artemisia annua]
MYAKDFSRVEKIGVEISKFLLEAIESIGPSNILQVVRDKATNCKAAGEEVEKLGERMTIPLHCLGFALTLRFYDKTYLSTKTPGGIPRKPPNQDKEVTDGVIDAFKSISENEEETQMLRAQYARFHLKKGLYSHPEIQIDAVTMELID